MTITDAIGKRVLDNINEAVFIRDLKCNIRYINRSAACLVGHSKEQAIGMKCFNLFSGDFQICRDVCELKKSGSQTWSCVRFEKYLKVKSGQLRHMHISIFGIEEGGNCTGAVVVMDDITKRRNESYPSGNHTKSEAKTKDCQNAIGGATERVSPPEQLDVGNNENLPAGNAVLSNTLPKQAEKLQKLSNNVTSNLYDLVYPYLDELGQTNLNSRQTALLKGLKANLNQLASPFSNQMTSSKFNLTPMEVKVADLVRRGLCNKEIAEIFGVSINTVMTHRFHIRKKLNLKNKNINLKSFLKTSYLP